MRRTWLGLLAVLALAGCPAAHNDFPSQACKTDSDCYLGERCMNNSICVAVPADLAAAAATTKVDMSRADGGTP